MISSAPGLPYSRDNRWNYFGLVNEPCFEKATGPIPSASACGSTSVAPTARPIRSTMSRNIPASQIGARGKDGLPVGSYYGEPTGIVGLRLFPNPAFDARRAASWDPERYYKDPEYYQHKDLVRPYRVGMSCAFCHVGPSPIKPPADPENPKWENLNSHGRRAVFLVRSHLRVERRPVELHLPAACTPHAGLARHLARLDRQHQQSAHHERDLLRSGRG